MHFKTIILLFIFLIGIKAKTRSSSSSSSSSSLPDHYRMTCTCDQADSSCILLFIIYFCLENYCSHYECVKESYTKSASCFPKEARVKVINEEENSI